jgi:hypothetical protein
METYQKVQNTQNAIKAEEKSNAKGKELPLLL